jgi:threonine synthase
MWPWSGPRSVADGILDDETYDWLAVFEATQATGGSPVVASEALVVDAHSLGSQGTGIDASATGTAGLAGLMAIRDDVGPTENVAVIFSGVAR